MKRIGIDARLYNETGVGVYIRNLLHYLDELPPSDMQFYVYVLDTKKVNVDFKSKSFIIRPTTSRWHSLAEQVSFCQQLYQDNLDLMHFTYFSYPVLYGRPFIATVHDVTPLLFKTGRASTLQPLIYEFKHLVFKFVLSSQIKNATKIITPTESVKKQLTAIYGKKIGAKITVTGEGVDYQLVKATSSNHQLPKSSNLTPKPFLLYVGNFYPHKNVERLIVAFQALTIRPDLQLVLVGPKNYFSERLRAQTKNPRVHFYLKTSLEERIGFYQQASALINPSLSEGFGLPIIEAVYFNLPILASNLPAFKELLGDKFTAFDPKSKENMREKIVAFIKNPPQVDYSGILEKYSFSKMTKTIIHEYKNLLMSKSSPEGLVK